MDTDRLAKYIAFLKTIPEWSFYFHKIVYQFDYDSACGTVCCAAGWLPVFDKENWDYIHRKPPNYAETSIQMKGAQRYGHLSYYIAEYFGISDIVADNIFFNEGDFYKEKYGHEITLADVIYELEELLSLSDDR